MSFGKDLSTDFQRFTSGVFYPEEELFCKLQDAFLVLKHYYLQYRYAIDIIHGRRSHVGFTYTGSTISSIRPGTTKTKEMADMMFVVLSKKSSEIRLTYLQNKKRYIIHKIQGGLTPVVSTEGSSDNNITPAPLMCIPRPGYSPECDLAFGWVLWGFLRRWN